MLFMLDENVPVDVADMLIQQGQETKFIRDYAPPGSPDPLVATVAQELNAVLLSFDGDFEVIAPRIAKGHRKRFRKLSRIWMRCDEPQAANRLKGALDLVVSEYALAKPNAPMRMWVSSSYLRTDR
jgi:predicted nuclease of predicted toxin-antitoxin system